MKKIFSFILLISLCSFTFLKTDESVKRKDPLIGIWTEHWGTDPLEEPTDVSYVDTLNFEAYKNGKIKICCINTPHYKYSKIAQKKKTLFFVMENTSTAERFTIQYSLMIINNDLLKGHILNSRGKRAGVTLKRLK